jgi:hypothetical protein
MRILRAITTVCTAGLLCSSVPLFADTLPPLLTTTAATTLDSGGRPWAFIALGQNRPEVLSGRHLGVYSKAGGAASFQSRGPLAPILDPAAIGVMLARGASVGDNLAALEVQLIALHALLLTPPGQPAGTNAPAMPLAQRLSAIMSQAAGDTRVAQLLDLYGLAHPALRLVRGTAWAGRLDAPVGTAVVIEVRELDANGTAIDVVGRVTVQAGVPDFLPAPGPIVVVPDTTASGDLAVHLRWATPNALRQAGSRHHGDVVWRLTKTVAEGAHYNNNPPAASVLDALVLSNPGNARRLSGPIFPGKLFDAVSVADFVADGTNSYVLDNNERFSPGGTPFVEGAQFYYFTAAADALGRPGTVSAGLLAMICRRLPPRMPSHLAATVQWNATDLQYWDVAWFENPPNEGTPTTRYELYRGNDLGQLAAAQRGALNLDANPIVPGQPNAIQRLGVVADAGGPAGQTLHFKVPGDGSFGTTWWFAIRAAHDGPPGSATLFSPLSPPVLSSLHDTNAPTGLTPADQQPPTLDCLRVACITDQPAAVELGNTNLDASAAHYLARCQRRPGSRITAAHFVVNNTVDGGVVVPETAVVFPPDEDVVELEWSMPLSQLSASLNVLCAAEALGTNLSAWATSSAAGVLPDGHQQVAHHFLAGAIAESERLALPKSDPLFGSLTNGCSQDWPADMHLVVSPYSGRILHPQFQILLGEGARQYRLYRRVEDGPMTLVAQGLQAYSGPGSYVSCVDSAPPVSNGRVHYFAQLLDENGRPGVMRHLAHLKFTGDDPPIPILRKPTPADFGGTPAAASVTLTWVAPPEHIERFEIVFATHKPPGDKALGISGLGGRLVQMQTAAPRVWKVRSRLDSLDVQVVMAQQSFLTGRVGADLGPGPRFTLTMQVDPSLVYRVFMRALGPNGEAGPPSQSVEFQWLPPAPPPSNVPWPMRPLPPVANFNSGIQVIDFSDIPLSRLTWGGDAPSVLANATPIGIRVGSLTVDNDGWYGGMVGPSPFGAIFRTGVNSKTFGKADPNQQVFTHDGKPSEHLLPAVLYRTQMANDLYPNVSGDVVQCSPLVRSVAWASALLQGQEQRATLTDPLFRWVGPDLPSIPQLDLFLVDTQPAVKGARYRYWLVRFSDLGEPIQTVPCGEVTVKSP